MMSSGRRYTALICCNSKHSALYLDPIEYYRPDSVHIFVSDDVRDIDHDIEADTFEKNRSLIRCGRTEVHECDTHDFEHLLSEISRITDVLRSENGDGLDVFINITSGTHEFAAAAMIASMFNNDIITAFRMDVTDDNGRCIISEPVKVTSLTNDVPDREMVVFMEIIDERLSVCRTLCFKEVISELKRRDAWSYDPKRKSNSGRDSPEHKELTYLARHYVKYALDCGWILRPTRYRISITPAGRSLLNVHSVGSDICMNRICASESDKIETGPVTIEQENEMFDILDSTGHDAIGCNINGKHYMIRHE